MNFPHFGRKTSCYSVFSSLFFCCSLHSRSEPCSPASAAPLYAFLSLHPSLISAASGSQQKPSAFECTEQSLLCVFSSQLGSFVCVIRCVKCISFHFAEVDSCASSLSCCQCSSATDMSEICLILKGELQRYSDQTASFTSQTST